MWKKITQTTLHDQGDHSFCAEPDYEPDCETGELHQDEDHVKCDEKWCDTLDSHNLGYHNWCHGPWCEVHELHNTRNHSKCNDRWCLSFLNHKEGYHHNCEASWCKILGLHEKNDHYKCDREWCETKALIDFEELQNLIDKYKED